MSEYRRCPLLADARVLIDGSVWMLVTRYGSNDPEGNGGYVINELGGSGCRWIQYDPTDVSGSLTRLVSAREWYQGREYPHA
jgi:hypothetical protein